MSPSSSGFSRSKQQFLNAFLLATDSIRGHKLRSFLTLLGVIIGVASVIMVGAAIEGLGVYAEQSTAKAFGSESFLVAQIAATGRLSRRGTPCVPRALHLMQNTVRRNLHAFGEER